MTRGRSRGPLPPPGSTFTPADKQEKRLPAEHNTRPAAETSPSGPNAMGQTGEGRRATPHRRENCTPSEVAGDPGDPGTWHTGCRNPAREKPEPYDETQGPDQGTSGRRLGGRRGCRLIPAEVALSPAVRRARSSAAIQQLVPRTRRKSQSRGSERRSRKIKVTTAKSHVWTPRNEHAGMTRALTPGKEAGPGLTSRTAANHAPSPHPPTWPPPAASRGVARGPPRSGRPADPGSVESSPPRAH